jgi:photosystem II stability/assembly factor-like uncharacterized protein
MKKEILACGLLLAILTACNLTSPGNPTGIPWETLRVTSPTGSLPSGGIPEITSTPTPVTPSATLTPTVNPLIVAHLEAGTAVDILRVEMIDPQNGWGIGGPRDTGTSGHVFQTRDGGSSWIDVTPPEAADSAAELSSMAAVGYFVDMQTGWITYHASIPSGVPSHPVVWRTSDGGSTWQASSQLDTSGLTETYWASHVMFVNTGGDQWAGWVLVHVGAGMNHDYVALYRSTDSGANWTRIIDPMIDGGIQSCTKTGLAFSDPSNGWLAGNCNGVRPGAFLCQTKDSGRTWEPVALTPPADHPDLFTAEQYACAVRAPFLLNGQALIGVECNNMADSSAAPLTYLYRGSTAAVPIPASYPGGDVFTLDGRRIWALGLDIYRTDDAGQNWTKISTVTWQGQFDFVSATLGWAAVRKGTEYGLVETADGGAIWAQLNPMVVAGP